MTFNSFPGVSGLKRNLSIPPTRRFILYPVSPAPAAPNNDVIIAMPATEPNAAADEAPKTVPSAIKRQCKVIFPHCITIVCHLPTPAATNGAAKPPVSPIKAPPPAAANPIKA